MADETDDARILDLATELTIAWLSNANTRVSAAEVPAFLQTMHSAVAVLASPSASASEAEPGVEHLPAVTVRRSLASKEHLVSLIDGKPYKMLKRHLSQNGLTPAQYRARYGLKPDYPMVAESYAQLRRELAKKIGLGRKAGTKMPGKKAAGGAPKSGAKTRTARAARPAPSEVPSGS